MFSLLFILAPVVVMGTSLMDKFEDRYLVLSSDTLSNIESGSDSINIQGQAASAVRKIFFLKGDSPWLKKISYKGKSIAFVNLIISTILFSIVTMIILLIIILLNRRRMEREEILREFLRGKYQGLIIDYLFGNASPEDFRPIASDNFRRQVLIDEMIDVSVNLKGEDEKKIACSL